MQNFHTNQTRHLYVAGAIDDNVDTNLDIALGQVATGEMYFKYRNADGLLTRSDTFDPKKITALTLASTDPAASAPFKSTAKALDAFEIELNTDKFSFGSSAMVGVTFNLKINVLGVFDYDDSNNIEVVASLVGNATNTATAGAFYKALALAINKVVPNRDGYPLIHVITHKSASDADVTAGASALSDATSVVIVAGPQKYVRGKLSGEPCSLSIASSTHAATATTYTNTESVVWAKVNGVKDTDDKPIVAKKAADVLAAGTGAGIKYVHELYALADLEYFCQGERGDYYRGALWPNDYTPEFAIPKPTVSNQSTHYQVLSIEYYWAGEAENVQKSPRMIQVAAPASANIINDLYDAIDAARNGVASS